MRFVADFHVHSKYSRATAKNLDLENLWVAAQKKGITVVGTGDFTHPDWFAEIRAKLVEAEAGLFRLKPEIVREWERCVPRSCRRSVRFVLTSEISNIYKKNGITRKNHNLIFMPALESVSRFNAALEKNGNIRSDGRPILGLDARNLLETALEIDEAGFLVPAHIWTPWFSLLGAKSGFDSIEECFDDLSLHIFALETGLSSDPPMNWRCSRLDGRTLISNSDAHSPAKLGREANVFNVPLAFHAIRDALRSGDPRQFEGTIEFYPQEGKYHLDGHRKCGVRMHPDETHRAGGQCPACGKPLTLGVLHRVLQLADRQSGEKPLNRPSYWNLIPLKEVLAEILAVGSTSKRVDQVYERLLARYGPEFDILKDLEVQVLQNGPLPLLAEAIDRMRSGRVSAAAGYDGAYGAIGLFSAAERRRLKGQRCLFVNPKGASAGSECQRPFALPALQGRPSAAEQIPFAGNTQATSRPEVVLNAEQQRAVRHSEAALIIVAGPGTGKTRTLTHRIAHLIDRKQVSPTSILALTFTRKAAEEMRQRLRHLLSTATDLPLVATFHALCLQILQEIDPEKTLTVIDDAARQALLRQAVIQVHASVDLSPEMLQQAIIDYKQRLQSPETCRSAASDSQSAALAAVYTAYQEILAIQNLCDYEDLILQVIERFERHPELCRRYRRRFDHILVDEYQDLNYGQYHLIKALAPGGSQLFVIGDPDQAIYGFRGADVAYFQCFRQDYPNAREIRLQRNYRSTETILRASRHVMAASGKPAPEVRSGIPGIRPIEVIECASERSEAVAVGRRIEQLVGGTGFHSFDFGTGAGQAADPFGFGDIAVLFRTRSQGPLLAEILESAGIPCQHVDKTDAFHQRGKRVLRSGLQLIQGTASYSDLMSFSEAAAAGCSMKALQPFISHSLSNRLGVPEALAMVEPIPIPGMKAEQQRKLAALMQSIESLRVHAGKIQVLDLLAALTERLKPSFVRAYLNLRDSDDPFFRCARECGRELDRFLLRTALDSDTDVYDEKVQKVALLTFHAAKGLEFPVVLITGCEEALLPLVSAGKQKRSADIEEERRLFYVGMTRARAALFVTWAKRRNVNGRVRSRRPSRFIDAIPKELVDFRKAGPRHPVQRQMKLFY